VINELGCCDQPSQMLKNMNLAWGQVALSEMMGKASIKSVKLRLKKQLF
jgi:hypothetical protein